MILECENSCVFPTRIAAPASGPRPPSEASSVIPRRAWSRCAAFYDLGSTANSLSSIQGEIFLRGSGSTEEVTFNDQGDAAKRTYDLTDNDLSRSDAADVYYAGMTALTLNGSQGNDVYNVTSKAAATATGLYAGAGSDLFLVSVDTLSGYAAFLVDGGTGVDSLFVADVSGGAVVNKNADSPTSGRINVGYNAPGALKSQIAYRKIGTVSTSPSPT